jgi:MATE family multidrug resistance protein
VITLGVGFMGAAAILFLVAPGALARLFTSDPAVLATSIALLRVAAAFQLFDGLQSVTTGALRGLGDTRTAMIANVIGHWLVGLPVSAVLAFGVGWGVIGLWAGLSLSLTIVGLVLVAVWRIRLVELTRHLAEAPRVPRLTARPGLQ